MLKNNYSLEIQKKHLIITGVLLIIVLSLWMIVNKAPITPSEAVKQADQGIDITDRYMRFEVRDIKTDTAIGDVIHTNDRNVVIKWDDDKYWEIGKTYSYKILEYQEALGVYIIMVDTEENE